MNTTRFQDQDTYFHPETPQEIREILETARRKGTRIRVHYGDTVTGRDWEERYDVAGRVGRSMGPCKVPILLHNRRSMGGGAMLDHCIVRIRFANAREGGDLYRHPKYHRGEP